MKANTLDRVIPFPGSGKGKIFESSLAVETTATEAQLENAKTLRKSGQGISPKSLVWGIVLGNGTASLLSFASPNTANVETFVTGVSGNVLAETIAGRTPIQILHDQSEYELECNTPWKEIASRIEATFSLPKAAFADLPEYGELFQFSVELESEEEIS